MSQVSCSIGCQSGRIEHKNAHYDLIQILVYKQPSLAAIYDYQKCAICETQQF